jgi:hypothetical protein
MAASSKLPPKTSKPKKLRWLVLRAVLVGLVLGCWLYWPALTLKWADFRENSSVSRNSSQVQTAAQSRARVTDDGSSVLVETGGLWQQQIVLPLTLRLDRTELMHPLFQNDNLALPPKFDEGILSADGFPALLLNWPSLDIPDHLALPGKLCTGAAIGADALLDCQHAVLPIRSQVGGGQTYMNQGRYALLAQGKGQLVSQQQTANTQRKVYQWAQFKTRRVDGVAQWAGWNCDKAAMKAMGQRFNAETFDDWVVAQLDASNAECHANAGLLERIWPRMAGLHTHNVLWMCHPGNMGLCEAQFAFVDRVINVQGMPGGRFKDTDTTERAAVAHQRPRYVQAAWGLLQRVQHEATAPPSAQQLLQRMQRQVAWCDAYRNAALRSAPLSAAQQQDMTTRWREDKFSSGLSAYSGPCARALDRAIAAIDADAPPAQAAALKTIQTLVKIEREMNATVPPRLMLAWERATAKVEGEVSLSMLRILLDKRRLEGIRIGEAPRQDGIRSHETARLLDLYQILGNAVEKMPVTERLDMRIALASDLHSQQVQELGLPIWLAAARDVVSQPAAVRPALASSVLIEAARDSLRRKAWPELLTYVNTMEIVARAVHDDPAVTPAVRAEVLAPLGLHTIFHGRNLAFEDQSFAQWEPRLSLIVEMMQRYVEPGLSSLLWAKFHLNEVRNRKKDETASIAGSTSNSK